MRSKISPLYAPGDLVNPHGDGVRLGAEPEVAPHEHEGHANEEPQEQQEHEGGHLDRGRRSSGPHLTTGDEIGRVMGGRGRSGGGVMLPLR